MPELSFQERAKLCACDAGRRVFETMARKQSCLSFNPDVTTKAEILETVRQVGAECCMIKTHMDVVSDFDDDLVAQLQKLSEELDFVIFEDRKFADIGNTAMLQYEHGHHRIASWSHVTNAHIVAGPGTVEALKKVGIPLKRGCLLVAEMSSKGTLADGGPYTKAAVEQAYAHEDFVFGFVAQRRITDHAGFLTLTPGVQLQKGGDAMGQQYNTPASVMAKGADIIQVGRGILNAPDRSAAAKEFRKQSWEAYTARLAESELSVPYPKAMFQ
ncbi:Uridine 5prime-monophosphate synthase [Diplonema papillatum]|uniref:Orotidine 5'-phosphate decarboxylase n=1 Tax=Diplonema papillatum TaxID=91374 RepID=A9CQ19_9EUGL|nr:Uridine 5prime-monophosphate synthase [Diplonema papillatum]BAF95082.1 orotidine-5'-monophosphate decarboxylase [Diplonema papillatum]